jgi:hypothetical protein
VPATAQRSSEAPSSTIPDALADTSIEGLRRAGEWVHFALEARVHEARLAGASWAQIGRLLGVSRQSAHSRWRYLDTYPVELLRLPDGEGVWRGTATQVVIGQAQLQQVQAVGRVLEHHSANTPVIRYALDVA